MKNKIDLLKIWLTIQAAEKSIERLEKAIEQNDHRTIGSQLYNAKREFILLRQIFDEYRKNGGKL